MGSALGVPAGVAAARLGAQIFENLGWQQCARRPATVRLQPGSSSRLLGGHAPTSSLAYISGSLGVGGLLLMPYQRRISALWDDNLSPCKELLNLSLVSARSSCFVFFSSVDFLPAGDADTPHCNRRR